MKRIKLLHTTLLFLFIALIFTTPMYSQGWHKQYNDEERGLNGRKVFQTSDQGFFLIGSKSQPDAKSSLIIIKTDENGVEQFRVEYEKYVYDYGIPNHPIASFSDDSFIIPIQDTIAGLDKLVKFANDGSVVWEKEWFDFIQSMDRSSDDVVFLSRDKLVKIDEAGNTIWIKEVGDGWSNFSAVTSLSSGGYAITGDSRLPNSGDQNPYLAKLDSEGNIIWNKMWPTPGIGEGNDIIETLDGNLLITGERSLEANGLGQIFLTKVNQSGEDIWNVNTDYILHFANSIVEGDNHQYYITGHNFTPNFDLIILSYDEAGNEIFKRDYDIYNNSKADLGRQIIHLSNNEFAIIGSTTRPLLDPPSGIIGEVLLLKVTEEGHIFSNIIEGNILYDQNENCTADTGELGLAGWVVTAEGANTYYGYTDENGNYSINLDAGNYDLHIQAFGYWDPCEDSYQINIDNTSAYIINQDFSVKGIVDCPYPIVDIATNLIRPCTTNTYVVNYCNYGTINVEDGTIEVTLDPNLIYEDASIPLSSQIDQVLTFEIGDLAVNECNSFQLTAAIPCDTLLIGQTLCAEAHFFPDSICLLPIWNGSIIETNGSCNDNIIEFIIHNVGENMPSATDYIIVEDNIILRQEPFQLLANEETTVTIQAASGSTYHMILNQQDDFPEILGNVLVTNSIEACDGEENNGLLNDFAEDDGESYLSIHCQEVVASFDPNDKQAFPRGWKEEHFIDNTTDLEYMIRFQNTGNDTAFVVRIEDHLSKFLNPASIRPGASSHSYTFDLDPAGIAIFTFENILLPDSMTNEAASQGFVKFRIAQQANNEPGTVILNKAAIYFDINSPVITNEVFHTIQEDWISILLDSDDLEADKQAMISIQPNPFRESTVLQLSVVPNERAVLQIYDLNGRSVREEQFIDQQFILHRKNLSAGLYIYTLNVDGILVDQGKIMVH